MDVIILDCILLLLVLVPILYFTIKLAVKHALQETIISDQKREKNIEK